jgi:hypothetical protein
MCGYATHGDLHARLKEKAAIARAQATLNEDLRLYLAALVIPPLQ